MNRSFYAANRLLLLIAPAAIAILLLHAASLPAEPPEENTKAKETAAQDVAAVQGKWTRQQKTSRGIVTVTKLHDGNSTIVTAIDPQGNVLYEHTSEFRIERVGRFRVFSHFNRVITAGPDKGKTSTKTGSYLFRIVEDHFVETHGLEADGDEAPLMIVWKRVAPEKDGKNET